MVLNANTAQGNNGSPIRVLVIADVDAKAQDLVERVLRPSGILAWPAEVEAPPAEILVVDVTQLRGDPLAGLRNRRAMGDNAPAIMLVARVPTNRLRDMFRLGVRDILLKPYRHEELLGAIQDLARTRSREGGTKELSRRLGGMQEDMRRRSEEIRMLSEIGRVVVSLDDLDQIFTRVAEAAAYVTDAEEANIYVADPEFEGLVLRASKHASERQASLQRLRVDDTLVGQVFRTGQPMLRQPSLEAGPLKIQTGFFVKSLINVPLRHRKEVVGVLGVYNRTAPRIFTEHHMTLLLALADWAGIALEHATLVQQARSASSSETIPMAPAAFLEALEHAISSLESVLDGTAGLLTDGQRDELSALQTHLTHLLAIPIATMDAEEAELMVDLPGLIKDVGDKHRLSAVRRGLELVTETGVPMPLFRGDSGRIRQVVEALVDGAIRRTMVGRVIVRAHRFAVLDGESEGMPLPSGVGLQDGTWVAVGVSDSSPGLPPDIVLALRSPTVDPSAGKTGASLSMGEVRMVAESMGGVLWHEQTPASTTLVFALPVY